MATTALKFIYDSNGVLTGALTSELPLAVKEGDGTWTIYSPQFKTIGFSTVSKEAALEDFKESLNLFFKVHFEAGSIEDALCELGWYPKVNIKKVQKSMQGASIEYAPHQKVLAERESFNIPIYA